MFFSFQTFGEFEAGRVRLWMCKSRERLATLNFIPKQNQREKFFRGVFGSATLEDLVNGDDGDEDILVDVRVRVELKK